RRHTRFSRDWSSDVCSSDLYFSTQSSTMPAAMATGNLTVRPWSIVTQVLYDKDTRKATGVEVLDAENNQTYVYKSKIVFLNASSDRKSTRLNSSHVKISYAV